MIEGAVELTEEAVVEVDGVESIALVVSMEDKVTRDDDRVEEDR